MRLKKSTILLLLVITTAWLPLAGGAQFVITDYGAVGDGKTNNAGALTEAIQAASRAGGGTVVVPPGDFMSGPIDLASHITLYLEAGATLRASTRLEDYPLEPDAWSGESKRKGLITTRNARNVTITGRGTIEGSGMAFAYPDKVISMDFGIRKLTRQGEDYMSPKFGVQHGPFAVPADRPGNLVRFRDCQDVLVSGITIQNAPTWTMKFMDSSVIKVLGVHINSFASDLRMPNDDGMDIYNCRFVQIADCDIQTSDDCIAVFGVENITVSNCTLRSRSAGVRVGWIGPDIKNGTFNNLVINSNRGLNVCVRGSGSVENIVFSNILIRTGLLTGNWWGKGDPIHVSALPPADEKSPGKIKDVRFSNIITEGPAGILVYGSDNSVIRNLVFDRVRVKMRNDPLAEAYGGNFDLRGEDRMKPEMSIFQHDIPAFYARNVDGLSLRGFEAEWADDIPAFFSSGIEIEKFSNVDIDGFSGRQAHKNGKAAVIRLSDGRFVSIRNSVATKDAGVFLEHFQVRGSLFVHNDLTRARSVANPAKLPFTASGNLMPGTGGR